MKKGYFSRVTLLPAARATEWYRMALRRGELYRDHAAIWRLFPGDGVPRDFLYHVGGRGPAGGPVYYVVSHRVPVASPGELLVEAKAYEPSFVPGEAIAFSLRANPTVSRGERGGRGQRHDVLMNAKRLASPDQMQEVVDKAAVEWLMDRGPGIGLTIDPETLRCDGYCQHVASRRSGGRLRFSSLDYDGVATVTDAERLVEALFSGVGHSKGFGCGLLMVRRCG